MPTAGVHKAVLDDGELPSGAAAPVKTLAAGECLTYV